MTRFTIMPEFIEGCVSNQYFFEVLCYFPMRTNPFKVCLDNRQLAYRIYAELARNSEMIYHWIQALNNTGNCIYKVNLENDEYQNENELFLAIANQVSPSKLIITSDKALFNDDMQFVSDNGITLLDPDEAAQRLSPTVIQISYGNNSPNIYGNNNNL